MTRGRRAWLACEPVLVMLAIIAGSWAVYLWCRVPWIARHYDELNTALFLYAPLVPILCGRAGSDTEPATMADYGLSLTGIGRGVLTFLAALAVVAPVYVLAMLWASEHGPAWFHPSVELHVPRAFGMVALFQVLQVALPEEFFFRGYAQGRMDLAFPGRVRVAGAPLGLGFLFANALFALAHPLQAGPHQLANWTRLETFFPGLLFGWLRARSGSLVAPVLMHAASNLLLFAVIRGG